MSTPPVTRGAPLISEMGSSGSFSKSSGNGGSSPPADQSINGLKFGKKIYFEDALLGSGAAAPSLLPSSKSASSSSSSSSRKVQGGQQQPPRCQVEGCKVDLTDAKAYYSRHKVCSMHSKSPKVIVGGVEQRFCQQCSRFHLLPEFDQGKRSCRRRLAGHNERRRKPPSGSVLSSRYGRLSSTMFDGGSRSGGFLLDFSAYTSPRGTGREAWPTARSSEQIPRNQSTVSGRSFAHQWQNSSQNPPSNVYLQASACGTGFSCSVIPSGECSTGVGVTDSSCALSLLSNQSWGSSNRASGVGVTNMVNAQGAPMDQSSAPPHGAAVTQYPNPSWGFKGNEVGNSSHDMHPDLGLGQISQPLNSQFSGELELLQDNRRQQYMELQQSRAYDSPSQHIHWTL